MKKESIIYVNKEQMSDALDSLGIYSIEYSTDKPNKISVDNKDLPEIFDIFKSYNIDIISVEY